jgi:hypothetical protein
MYQGPDGISYDVSGVDASGGPSSAPSVGPGSNSGNGAPDSGPSIAAQVDGYLTGSGGGFPGLLGYTPAGAIAKGATAVMEAIFGLESIGPMGAFPGDAVSVSQDMRPAVLADDLAAIGKIDAGPVQPGTGEGFLSDFLSGFMRGASGAAAPDPRVNMDAQTEMLFFKAGQIPPASFAPSPAATAAGEVTTLPSAYGPLQLEVTKPSLDWSGLLFAAVAAYVALS